MSKNTIAKNTFYLYFRMLVSMGVSLYTSRVILNALGIQDFGLNSLIGGVVVLFGFLNSTMASATQRFLSIAIGNEKETETRKTFSAALVIHIGIMLLVLLAGETIGLWMLNHQLNIPQDRLEAANFVYQFSLVAAAISITQAPYNALILAHERMRIFAMFGLVAVFGQFLIACLLPWVTWDRLKFYSVCTFAITLSMTLMYRVYCLRQFKESKFKLHRDGALYRSMASYSAWNLFGNIAGVGRSQGNNIIINLFYGTQLNAAYGVMMQVERAVLQFARNFQMAANPQIYKTFGRGAYDDFFQLTFKSSKLCYYLMLVMVCPIIYNVDYLLKFWLGQPPEHAARFVVWDLIYIALDSISFPLITAVQASGRVRSYQAILGTFIFLSVPGSYFLNRWLGDPLAFLYVIVVITVCSLIFRLFYLPRLFDFPSGRYLREVLVPMALVTTIMVATLSWLHFPAETFLELALGSGIVFGFTILVIVTLGISSQERSIIIEWLYEKVVKKIC